MNAERKLDIIETAKPHSIKKFELISKYTNDWAYKLLGYEKTKGIIYIDCMCNCGMYYDLNGELIEGTAIRVIKFLNNVASKYAEKKVILFFNDIEEAKVEKLKEFVDRIEHSSLKIHYSVGDGNQFLNKLNIERYLNYNSLLIYDPYKADIDWQAVCPYLNTWGEVIINHIISDTIRASSVVKKEEKICKYQETYQKSIEEIIAIGSNIKKLDNIIIDIIKEQTNESKREHFIASFPFFNRNNGLVYNLIHCCSNIEGLKLYKKIAWQTFGGKSSMKNTHGKQNQLCIGLDDINSIDTVIDENCFYVKNIAKYVYDKYNYKGEVKMEDIYYDLDRHPIFPSDGFKKEIKKELESNYGVSFPRGKNTAVFKNGEY